MNGTSRAHTESISIMFTGPASVQPPSPAELQSGIILSMASTGLERSVNLRTSLSPYVVLFRHLIRAWRGPQPTDVRDRYVVLFLYNPGLVLTTLPASTYHMALRFPYVRGASKHMAVSAPSKVSYMELDDSVYFGRANTILSRSVPYLFCVQEPRRLQDQDGFSL